MTATGLMILVSGLLLIGIGSVPQVAVGARKAKSVYFGWWVLVSTFLLGVISGGIFSHSNGIFFGPIKEDLRLSSTQTSLIFSLARAEGSVAGPIVGPLVDRFGSQPMIIIGGIIAGLGFIALHWVHGYLLFVVIFIGLVSTGKSAGLGQVLLSAVNRWFIRRRSLAMSICITGFSSGGAVLLPLVTIGVHTIGWRDVMLYSGIFMCLIVLPLAAIIRHSPERMGLEPDGIKPGAAPASTQGTTQPARDTSGDFTVAQALRTQAFWILSAGTIMRITLWGAISIHSVEMMVWKGMGQETAGLMFSLMFFLSIPMRIGAGVLGDRMPIQPLMCGGMMAAGLATLAMLVIEGNIGIYLFVFLMAVEQGGSTLNWVALGNFFGRSSFGTLMGMMSFCFNMGMLVSPIYAGWIVDQTQSYTLVLLTFIPVYMASGGLFLLARKPTLPRSSVPSPAAA